MLLLEAHIRKVSGCEGGQCSFLQSAEYALAKQTVLLVLQGVITHEEPQIRLTAPQNHIMEIDLPPCNIKVHVRPLACAEEEEDRKRDKAGRELFQQFERNLLLFRKK